MKVEDAVKEFEAGGARVIRGDAVPAEKRSRLAEIVKEYSGLVKSRRPVPFWRIHAPRKFVYEDERCTLVLPIPRLDIFAAFFEEFKQLPDALKVDDPDAAIGVLARAFTILHIRPKWYQRKWIPEFEIDTTWARNFLLTRLPTDIVLTSLPLALGEFTAYVTGIKKKTNGAPPPSADSAKP